MDYKFKNKHIETAFQIVSSVSVSGDMVDVFWAVRQQLVMADQQFETPKKEAEDNG